jgi:NitT/TauT family transport system permease protein
MRSLIRSVYGFLVIMMLWTILHYGVRSAVIPAPWQAIYFFFTSFRNGIDRHLAVSLYRIITAIGVSILIGLPIGILMGITRTGDKLLSPVIYIAYPIPKIAFIPVLMILFGLGDGSKIVLIVLIIVFQIMLGVRDGIREIPLEVHLSAQSLGLNLYKRLIHIVLPGILPKLFTSLRISSGIAISALFLSENYATTYGIGYYIMNHWIMADYTAMFAGIIGLSLMGYGIFKLIDLAQRRWCRWMAF